MTKKTIPAIAADEALFQAAGALFRKQGFAATTVREIAAAAGMLPGSLHYRFASKDDLLLALMERGIARALATVRVAIGQVDDPLERLRLALTAHLDLLVRADESTYVLLYEWRALIGSARTRMARLRDAYDALWDGLLFQAAGAGRIRPDVDIRLTRLFILGSVNWVAQWYSTRGAQTPEEIAAAMANVFLAGILTNEARAEWRPGTVDGRLQETRPGARDVLILSGNRPA
jgi:AcrR family transcriptional regulator